mgnify:CR=1 FL=1
MNIIAGFKPTTPLIEMPDNYKDLFTFSARGTTDIQQYTKEACTNLQLTPQLFQILPMKT